MGVTAVELMPIHEFPILDIHGNRPERSNLWGYDSMAFFSPHRGYAAGTEPGCQVNEFKEMVKALHQAGIEVILDVVFNHTCEGNELGPTLSFKGLENRVYYMLDNGGSRYRNFSGCGNTVNGNHPIVREMIFHCLRHWVHNYHVDGFRFDLASILSRDQQGHLKPNPPLVEAIAEDPLLSDTKIIAEAWDAAGAYQVGSFGDPALNTIRIGRIHNAIRIKITTGLEALKHVKNLFGKDCVRRCGRVNFIPKQIILGTRNHVARTVKEVAHVQSWRGWIGHVRESIVGRVGKYLLK